MQCRASESRPHRCLWRTYPEKRETFKTGWHWLKLKSFLKQNALQAKWWYLTGWDPMIIPLQFSAAMALSACLQNKWNQKSGNPIEKQWKLLAWMDEINREHHSWMFYSPYFFYLSNNNTRIAWLLCQEDVLQTIPWTSGENTSFLKKKKCRHIINSSTKNRIIIFYH